MEKENIMDAIGGTYLKGRLSKTWIEDKFCIMENLEPQDGAPMQNDKQFVPRLRFPLKVTLTISVFCRQGRITIRIQQKDYVLEAGGILVIFGGQILENIELLEDTKVIIVAINSEYIMSEMRGPHGRSLRQWLLHNQEPALVSIPTDEADNYDRLCQSLKFIVKNSDTNTADGILSGFTYIFASLLLKWRSMMTVNDSEPMLTDAEQEAEPAVYSREREVLTRFQNDIHNFSRKDRTVGFYARRQCISEKHFSRLVKKASGHKPLELIREYVLLDAKSLLISGKYSIKEVSETLGFQNHSFFTRFFRLSTGKTPGEYMREE